MEQEKTFYEQLQEVEGLDLRDKRGTRLNLPLALLGLLIGLLRKRDGCLSSVHRSMKNKHKALCDVLGLDNEEVVSRPHLPILLQKVNLPVFEALLFSNYGIKLSETEKFWFSGDGKEMRGSIEKGDKRGEAVVQLVRHGDRMVLGQDFYNGTKESEIPCLRSVIKQSGAANQKITADALHLNPETTELINGKGGTFLIGLKCNQEELLEDMSKNASFLNPVNEGVSLEKGHGRIDKRTYFHYDVSWEYFEDRWAKSGFRSLFKVIRERFNLSTGEQSSQTAYYISNGIYSEQEDYFTAIRRHWSVEVNNHIRDVTLREDHFRTKKRA